MNKPTQRLVSWNVNGIRSVMSKGFLEWFKKVQPDILALQETRAHASQVPSELLNVTGYDTYWLAAKKKGYSGVGLLSKTNPLAVTYGIGVDAIDREGRILTAFYDQFTLVNAYFPSGTSGQERIDYKLAFNDAFLNYCEGLRGKGKPLVFCGDVNTAHREIDLANPKSNVKNSGFLPIERDWLDKLMSLGYVDTFRHFYPDETDRYSWWTVRAGARARNVGWRIDYVIASENFMPNVQDAFIWPDIMGSDHCPVGITFTLEESPSHPNAATI